MGNLKTWLCHLRIRWLGDKELHQHGKIIPCKKCNTAFKSYCHFGELGYVYDSLCDKCDKK